MQHRLLLSKSKLGFVSLHSILTGRPDFESSGEGQKSVKQKGRREATDGKI